MKIHLFRGLIGLVLLFGCDAEQRPPITEPTRPTPMRTDASNLVDMDSVDASVEVDAETIVDLGAQTELDFGVDAEIDSAVFPEIPFSIETRIGERRTRAGIENRVTRQVLNQVGEPIEA